METSFEPQIPQRYVPKPVDIDLECFLDCQVLSFLRRPIIHLWIFFFAMFGSYYVYARNRQIEVSDGSFETRVLSPRVEHNTCGFLNIEMPTSDAFM